MSNPQANPQIAIPSRAPAATTADDTVMPFEVAKLDLRGRVVRLGPAVDEILARHAYPHPVAKLLGTLGGLDRDGAPDAHNFRR